MVENVEFQLAVDSKITSTRVGILSIHLSHIHVTTVSFVKAVYRNNLVTILHLFKPISRPVFK